MILKEETDIRDLIMTHLKSVDRNLAWLKKKTAIPYGTLYYCLKRKQFKLSKSNLSKINEALETEFVKPDVPRNAAQ